MTQHRWTEHEIADLLRLYPDKTISLSRLEQHFGRRKGTIKQQARRLGLRRPSREWSEQDITDLTRMYTDEDISREQVIERFDCTWKIICHKAAALGLRRPRPNTRGVVRDYFHVIDSDERAYWLGFIAADGTVVCSKRRYHITVDLQQGDLRQLERFRNTVAPGATITKHESRSYSVCIGSKEMVHHVMAYGITPRKSDNLKWPLIPEAFVVPFLLGYFDGDGTFTPRIGRHDYQWLLLGTLDFLCIARDYIHQYTGVELKEPVRAHKHTSPHLYPLSANGPRAPIIDRILNASGLGMPRKHLRPYET